jgi:polar amino acid transport system substrate-binding protein
VRGRRVYAVVSLMVAALLALAGCASNEENTGSQPTGTATGAADPNAVQKDDALAGQVPDAVKSDGKLVIGTDPTYEPSEFKDASGKIIGFDIDLGTAIAKKLGLTPEFKESKFDNIIPGLAGKYELGMSSFTDSKEREKSVDFVTYFVAGTAWAAKDASFDPDNACGKKVSVQTGTVQETEDLPKKSKACTDAGKPKIGVLRYDGQDEATNAVVLGRAEAVLADLPVIVAAVNKTNGALQRVGENYDTAPYGIAMSKNAGTLKDAVLGAVKALIADGTYKSILERWKVADGAITDPVVNGAQS